MAETVTLTGASLEGWFDQLEPHMFGVEVPKARIDRAAWDKNLLPEYKGHKIPTVPILKTPWGWVPVELDG